MAGLLDFISLRDMFDGGGAGRAGKTFEGGPLSGLLNTLGIRPMGYRDRLEDARPIAPPAARPTAPTTPAGIAPAAPVTSQPLIGGLTPADILEAIQRGAPAPYAQPAPPQRMPSLYELMLRDQMISGQNAVAGLGMGMAFPVQPAQPAMPTLQELMEADELRRRRQAGIDLQMGFGNVFPQFTMGRR